MEKGRNGKKRKRGNGGREKRFEDKIVEEYLEKMYVGVAKKGEKRETKLKGKKGDLRDNERPRDHKNLDSDELHGLSQPERSRDIPNLG